MNYDRKNDTREHVGDEIHTGWPTDITKALTRLRNIV